MMRYLVALVFTMFFAGNALSGQCPALVNQIDQQLQSAQLDSETEARLNCPDSVSDGLPCLVFRL